MDPINPAPEPQANPTTSAGLDPAEVALHFRNATDSRLPGHLRLESKTWLVVNGVVEEEEYFPNAKAKARRPVKPLDAQGNPKRERAGEPRAVGEAVDYCCADVVPRSYDWICPDLIAIGEPAIFYGDCDQGKSMLSISLASTVTTGGCWPGRPAQPATRGTVLFVQDEDTVETTFRPRVDAAGGDPRLIRGLDHIRFPDGRESPFSFDRHFEELSAWVAKWPEARLCVIDPITAFLGKADQNSEGDVRHYVMRPLSRLSKRHKIGVVLIGHNNKGTSTKATSRGLASVAFINASRCAYLVATDPDDPGRRLVAAAKYNIGVWPDGLSYRFHGPSIRWEPQTIPGLKADDILIREHVKRVRSEGDGQRGPVSRSGKQCRQWLRDAFAQGPERPLSDLNAQGEKLGFSRWLVYDSLGKIGAKPSGTNGSTTYRMPPGLELDGQEST